MYNAAQIRTRVSAAITDAYPKAKVSWEGTGSHLKLYVSGTPAKIEWLTIDTTYADTPDRLEALIDDVLDTLA